MATVITKLVQGLDSYTGCKMYMIIWSSPDTGQATSSFSRGSEDLAYLGDFTSTAFYHARILIYFDLSGVTFTAGDTLNSATLSLKELEARYDLSIINPVMDCYRVKRDWISGISGTSPSWWYYTGTTVWTSTGASDGTLDRESSPSATTNIGNSLNVATPINVIRNLNVTSDVSDFLNGVKSNYGWVIQIRTASPYTMLSVVGQQMYNKFSGLLNVATTENVKLTLDITNSDPAPDPDPDPLPETEPPVQMRIKQATGRGRTSLVRK